MKNYQRERLRNRVLSVPPFSFESTSSLLVASPEKFIVMTFGNFDADFCSHRSFEAW
jgi:hypothetical protein